MGKRGLRKQKRRTQIHVQRPVPTLGIQLLYGTRRIGASGVHKDVQATEGLDGISDGLRGSAFIGEVHRRNESSTTRGGDVGLYPLEILLIPRHQRHGGAGRGESVGNGAAQTAARTGY